MVHTDLFVDHSTSCCCRLCYCLLFLGRLCSGSRRLPIVVPCRICMDATSLARIIMNSREMRHWNIIKLLIIITWYPMLRVSKASKLPLGGHYEHLGHQDTGHVTVTSDPVCKLPQGDKASPSSAGSIADRLFKATV